MQLAKKLGAAFVIGGCLAVVAQIIYNIISQIFTNPDFLLSNTLGPDTLVLMAMLGGITGGLGFYRHLANATGMGASVPFSGFAFGIGNMMIEGWTEKEPKKGSECFMTGFKALIWYNVVVFAVTLGIAALYYYVFGIKDSSTALFIPQMETATSGPLLYLTAFICCGIICVIFEFFFQITHISLLNMLMIVWISGAVLAPTGLVTWLSDFSGMGVDVTVVGGGHTLLCIYYMYFNGVGALASTAQLMVLIVTIICLFLCACMCWGIHNLKYGHKPQNYKELALEGAESGFKPVGGGDAASGKAADDSVGKKSKE